ncbi:MAG: hypothetical protein DCC75_07385 [Proteobacteria bacterium]|nr:MAG: hypothetical protein DCC75_07385 [Pseudomonadota bacterium]
MPSAKKKEICLWVVQSHDGKVRKVRLSLRALVAGFCAAVIIGSTFLYIASDYARIQVLRAKSYLHLRLVSAERDDLVSSKEQLESQVEVLQSANSKAAHYEKQVKDRLAELASVIGATKALNSLENPVADSRKAPGKGLHNLEGDSMDDGIGGAEIDCSGDTRSEACAALFSDTSFVDFSPGLELRKTKDSKRARIEPSLLSLVKPRAEVANDRLDLIEVLDRYIDLLKIVPLGLPAPGHINSGFGYRYSPFRRGITMHEGVDFSLSHGSLITSTGDGLVRRVARNSTYGLVVDVAHSERILTRYAHLSKALVTDGEKICRGEVLGLAGSTGRSTGPHLHYEVIIDGKAINPIQFIDLTDQLAKTLL